MTATASAPISAAWAASATVSAVVCAPAWTIERAAQRGAEGALRRAPLVDRQEHALAGRAAREDAIGAVRLQEGDVRGDRSLVERGAAVAERRDGGDDERAVAEVGQHAGRDPAQRSAAIGVDSIAPLEVRCMRVPPAP